MNILITGANGFIGKNLAETLKNIRGGKDKTYGELGGINIFEFNRDTPPERLDEYCRECDFVFHLAGVNRPENESEFMDGNFGFTFQLLDTLKRNKNKSPVLITSSVQAELDNPYGKSKRAAEKAVFEYGRENGVKTFVYRLCNVFGKWAKPNYNSAVATFCHNIARGLPIEISDTEREISLVYIDDVVNAFINALKGNEIEYDGVFCGVTPIYKTTLGVLTKTLYDFKTSRERGFVPDMSEGSFSKKLYSTYLSSLPENGFGTYAHMHCDERGSFTELFKSTENGQVSVNISKPGITKGNHWHHTKNEKFAVVSGTGVIRLRRLGSGEITEYFVSGEKMQIVDIPPGYTHSIENIGSTDMITVMWCNECFDESRPDTYFLEV